MNNRAKCSLSLFLLAVLFSLPISSFAALGDYTGDSFNTGASGNLSARGVVEYNGFFWITDDTDDEVYKYNPDGTYTGVSFNTAASGNGNPLGITAYDDFFWVTDDADNEVYKYNPDGTYTGVSFDVTASGNANPIDITSYNDFLWITDSLDGEVYKYNPDGTYTTEHFDTAASGNGTPRGIVYYNNFFWITDDADDEIYKFNSDGTYAGVSYDTAGSGNGNPLGIATYNDFLWVTDDADDSLYKYNPDGTYTGTVFYFGSRSDPFGIAEYDDFFWIVDNAEAEVYKYETDLTYTGEHFDTAASGAANPQGIVESGGFFWITDIDDREVYKYNLDGTYAGVSFDTDASGNTYPSGITYLEDFFWISDYFQAEVYKYNPDGTYAGVSFDTGAAGNNFSESITSYDGFLWTVDDGTGEVYKYNTAGVYQAFSFDTSGSGNIAPGGVMAYDNSFWITDYLSNRVYLYEGEDIVAPTVDTLIPLDNAIGVAINSNLVIEFDEDVDVESGNISIFKSSDDTLVEAIDVTGGLVTGTGTNTITINPTADLDGDTSYYVQIDATAFDDAAGNSYAGITDTTTWNFTTVDVTNPIVTDITPLDGAVDVAINTNLVIEFSEAVDAESGNIVIKNAVGDVVVETIDVTSGQVVGSGTNIITLDLLADLENGTSYYVQIDATAFDDATGNSYAGIADSTSWNFTTAALPLDPQDNDGEIVSSGSNPNNNEEEGVTPVISEPEPECVPPIPREIIPSTETLRSTSTRSEIKGMQQYLNRLMNTSIFEDGDYGKVTKELVAGFQAQFKPKLQVSGIVDEPTRLQINSSYCDLMGEEYNPNTDIPLTPPTLVTAEDLAEALEEQEVILENDINNQNGTLSPNMVQEDTDESEDVSDNVNNNTSSTESNSTKDSYGNTKGFLSIVPVINFEFWDNFSSFIQTPTGNIFSKFFTTLGLISGAVMLFAGTLIANPLSFADLGLNILQLWSMFLYGLGIKRKNRSWGTVYDSVTKQPLDPAYVVLKNKSGEEVATCITDLDGRYGFLVPAGTYTLIASKTNYAFPSAKLAGKDSDELYNDLYFGEIIEVQTDGGVITENIPLDPVNFDWNEFAKNEQGRMRFFHQRDLLISKMSNTFFSFGFVLSILILFAVPAPYNFIIFSLYVFLFLLRKLKINRNSKGSVLLASSGIPVSFGILRVHSVSSGQEVAHSVLDRLGNYYCLVPNGRYVVSIEKKNDEGSYSKIFTSQSVEVNKGILKKHFKV